jgi:hypothetical protein
MQTFIQAWTTPGVKGYSHVLYIDSSSVNQGPKKIVLLSSTIKASVPTSVKNQAEFAIKAIFPDAKELSFKPQQCQE